MHEHTFLFQPGVWIGEGEIAFPSAKETARFFTRWRVLEYSSEKLICLQEVELQGIQQTNRNEFTLFAFTPKPFTVGHFKIVLKNETIGELKGKGIVDPKSIAWELRDDPGLEGYEVYEKQESGDYLFRAEYVSGDEAHTLIQGKIWLKGE